MKNKYNELFFLSQTFKLKIVHSPSRQADQTFISPKYSPYFGQSDDSLPP
jgi:hypothetical protein